MKKTRWIFVILVLLLMLIPLSTVLADTLYTVQPGDNLSKIARKFETTVEAIVAANRIVNPYMIGAGMSLTIPTAGQPAEPEQPAASPSALAVSGVRAELGNHVVQLGDSLSKIAVQYGVNTLSLAWLNAIEEPYILQVGQILTVPNPLPSETVLESAPDGQTVLAPSANTAQVSPPTTQQSPVRVYETTVSIPTYDYEAAFQPTDADDAIYPYPRMDHGQVGGASSRSYKAVVLENGYVSVTVLPELGGRVYSWKDKATGRELLYQNPVIKPTNWGYRGWWLAAGGIEWAFPVEEHGLNEWRPWSYSVGPNSVSVSDIEDRTGMEVGATISLNADDAVMSLEPWARNNTESAQQYQLWLNGMMTLGDNDVSDQTQFILPVDQVIVHSTGDVGLPEPEGLMGFPVHNGRDMGTYGNWDGYLGFFAPTDGGFSGLYDHSNGQGMVRAFSPGWPAGTKFFAPSMLSPSMWTDDLSNYVELWSGATPSFWDYTSLEPGQTVSWNEHWYPIHGIGGYNFANRQAAMRLSETGSGADVALAVSAPTSGKLTLFAGNMAVSSWPVAMGPGQALQASWSWQSGEDGPLGLRLEDSGGAVLAQMGQVP